VLQVPVDAPLATGFHVAANGNDANSDTKTLPLRPTQHHS
jgi:hypothetical protein